MRAIFAGPGNEMFTAIHVEMIDRLSDMRSTFSVATSLSFYENYENDTRVVVAYCARSRGVDRYVLRVWKSRPIKGSERGREKREGKEILCRDCVDSGSTGQSSRTERHTNKRREKRKSKR